MKKILLFLAAGVMLSSCEDFTFGNNFLETPIGGNADQDEVFSTELLSEQVLNQIYYTLPDYLIRDGRLNWNCLETITDLCDQGRNLTTAPYHLGYISSSEYRSMAYMMDWNYEDASSVNSTGSGSATAAFRYGHIYLENIDNVTDMTQEQKDLRKGEVKLIMAIHYVDVFRNLGGMPWIDKYYMPDDDMDMTRMTIEEAVENIIGLIDEAIELLPWSVSSSDAGRMHAAGAMALKTRLLLYAASPLFNADAPFMEGEAADKHYVWWGDYDQNRWQPVIDAGLEFLRRNETESVQYKLVDTGNPHDDFNNAFFTRHNGELLLSSHRWATHNKYSKVYDQYKWCNNAPVLRYVDMFQMTDGTEFDWENEDHKNYPFFDKDGNARRDPRLYETVWVNEDWHDYYGRKAEIYMDGREGPPENHLTGATQISYDTYWRNRARSGIAIKKLIHDGYYYVHGLPYSNPLMRLPEVYLNIAEAMVEMGLKDTKDEFGRDAYDYVDLVRNRVDMPGLDRSMSTEELREAIYRERALEFGYEEIRYYDINRLKKREWLEEEVRYLFTEKNDDGAEHPFTHTIIYGPIYFERQWVTTSTAETFKYYLSPIPLGEINKDYGLVQNPGW
ncbi:MAG: RagB/SusD family nutrient uptake outer membrane protein [Rikenellaceae bacterium]